MTEVYRIDAANIMHEVIEGEVVVVNLESGTYYSLDATGAELWTRLTAGGTLDALVDGMTAHYGADRAIVAHGVSQFLRHLEHEKLVVTTDASGAASDPGVEGAAPTHPYSDPVLHKYTDMEELLLVDPIHEVEDSGWPNTR